MASSIQATRLRKGNLIKLGNDLFRILDLQHMTPGNKRGFIQARMRNIRTGTLMDEKFRAEEDIERATLDEREMQYLYSDGDAFYFMDTSSYEQIHISAEALGDSKDYLIPEMLIRVEDGVSLMKARAAVCAAASRVGFIRNRGATMLLNARICEAYSRGAVLVFLSEWLSRNGSA